MDAPSSGGGAGGGCLFNDLATGTGRASFVRAGGLRVVTCDDAAAAPGALLLAVSTVPLPDPFSFGVKGGAARDVNLR